MGETSADRGGDGLRASRSPVSVALLAGLAAVPIVVAAGLLADAGRAPRAPVRIGLDDLRGPLDRAPAGAVPVGRAGL